MSNLIEPTLEQLKDPYVLQLLRALAMQDDEIEAKDKRIAELEVEVISAKCGAFRAGYFSGAIDKGFFVEVDEDTAMTSFDRWVDKDCPKPNTPVSGKQEGDT